MKYLPLIALLIATPAYAKDVTITLTDQEQQVYRALLDAALKCGGLGSINAVNQFLAKLQAAAMPPAPEKDKK